MEANTHYLFVYGTLKAGFRAHHLLEECGAVFVDNVWTHSRYTLYDLGCFPGMIVEDNPEGDGVFGELYKVPTEALQSLDYYEGVSQGLFRREEIELDDGSRVMSYLYAQDLNEATRVDTGLWSRK